MLTLSTFKLIVFCWMALAVIVFAILFFVNAPFGRHTTEKWGATINNKLGWVFMELPSLLIMIYFLFSGTYSMSSYVWILFVLWIAHYFNRSFIYPIRIKATPKKMPLVIVVSAIFFNFMNAGLNGYYLAELALPEKYDVNWFSEPNFVIGLSLFFIGMFINLKSDSILINLRKPGETGYKIPKGFLFEYISSPNLFGEIIEWTGFAILAWNLPAASFMIWTIANLVPRAVSHHKWNLQHFSSYPKNRKAIIPFFY